MNTPKVGRSKQSKRDRAEAHTVWVATAWWRDCDPFASVATNTAEEAERLINRAIRDAATDAYNSSEPDDTRTVEQWAEEIAWSGCNQFRLAEVVSDSELDRYFAGVACASFDHTEMDALLHGEKDASIWLEVS